MPRPAAATFSPSNRRWWLTDKLTLLLWAATPDHPDLCVTPLVHALAARALDAEVEIHFAGPADRLLVAGVADGEGLIPECAGANAFVARALDPAWRTLFF
jgi:predicted peroxiredoxin